jgi:hypothetical protein
MAFHFVRDSMFLLFLGIRTRAGAGTKEVQAPGPALTDLMPFLYRAGDQNRSRIASLGMVEMQAT